MGKRKKKILIEYDEKIDNYINWLCATFSQTGANVLINHIESEDSVCFTINGCKSFKKVLKK